MIGSTPYSFAGQLIVISQKALSTGISHEIYAIYPLACIPPACNARFRQKLKKSTDKQPLQYRMDTDRRYSSQLVYDRGKPPFLEAPVPQERDSTRDCPCK